MKKIFLILCCLPLLATTCEDETPVNCTTEAVAGLNVTVFLADGTTPVADGVTVTATEADYTENLNAFADNSPVFSGAYERVGNYIVKVSKAGYLPYVSESITVEADVCHVIPQQLEVHLQPE